MPDNPTPEMLKKMKMDTSSSPGPSTPASSANGSRKVDKSRQASVRDEEEEEEAERMEEDFAPGGDADYFVEEDDEGRFFGGGLTREQKDILNIFDNAGGEDVREDVCQSPCHIVRLETI